MTGGGRARGVGPLHARIHGEAGPPVVLVHGGPGAPGSMGPLGRALASSHRVLEPFQRRSGGAPLTVARHVEDLQASIEAFCGGARPAVVGHSWGAMLALAHVARHPRSVRSVVLVGCGTFDTTARAELEARIVARTTDADRDELARIEAEVEDPDERLGAEGAVHERIGSFDLLPGPTEHVPCDARGHRETWQDVLRLQREGVHPQAFTAIRVPVLFLHGAEDPHPGALVHASLAPFVEHLELRELQRCGHTPWRERHAREEFLRVLADFLGRTLREEPPHAATPAPSPPPPRPSTT